MQRLYALRFVQFIKELHSDNFSNHLIRKEREIKKTTVFIVIILMSVVTLLTAQVPRLINYQGSLTDEDNNPVNATLSIEFKMYNAATDGEILWSENQSAVTVSNGLFNVLLGSINPIPDKTFEYSEVYLSMKIGEDSEMTPRKRLVSVGYSFHSIYADTARFAHITTSGGGSNTLDQAYDQGGAGAGRTITADAGAVNIAGAGGLTVNGAIGIHTTTPTNLLTVVGPGTEVGGAVGYPEVVARFKRSTTGGHSAVSIDALSGVDAALYLSEAGAVKWGLRTDASADNAFKIRYQSGNRTCVTVDTTGRVGIGITSPTERLDVAGIVKMQGLQLTNSPTAGYVLTSDASGVGSWQPAGEFTLPYHGIFSSAISGAVFRIDNTNTVISSTAIYGSKNQNYGTLGSRYRGVLGYSHNSTDSDDFGYGVYGKHRSGCFGFLGGFIKATGDEFNIVNEYGVYGEHTNGNFGSLGNQSSGAYGFSNSNYGVYGTSNTGAGVRGISNSGRGGYFASEGTNSTASGLFAKGGPGGGYAAEFQGNVVIRKLSNGVIILELGEGLDYAEGFDVSQSESITPGTVLSIDPEHPGQLVMSTEAYDTKVAGIVAGAAGLGSGVRLGSQDFDHDVALAGRVYCNVDATTNAIEPGDLLTTSVTPGYAAKATDYSRAQGAILGKAMQRLEKGHKGQILVLVTLQ